MSFNPADFHPKFVSAMEAMDRIPEAERDDHPDVPDLMGDLMMYAPEWLQAIFRAKARELGLFPPEPAYYTENGEPMYTTEQVANHLGLSVEEVNRKACELADAGNPHFQLAGSQKLYRRQ